MFQNVTVTYSVKTLSDRGIRTHSNGSWIGGPISLLASDDAEEMVSLGTRCRT
jgi:hypothetical protein